MYRALYKLSQHKVILSILTVVVMGMVLVPTVAFGDSNDVFGINVIEKGSTNGTTNSEAAIKLGTQDLRVTISRIINVALSLLGVIAVVIILIGGFQWMTAGGNEEKVGGARKMIFSGIIGLAIILSAWAIAKFVLKQLGTATNVNGANDYN